MLGRLAKWLRILGFDAAYPRSALRPGRIFVTTKKGAISPEVITVRADTVEDQLREVFDQAGINADPDLFLSRCLTCNVPVREIPRENVEGKVPEAVLRMTTRFHECPCCGRIYWEGTHGNRIKKLLEKAQVLGFTLIPG